MALIYVSFAYTGWNAATYLSSELRTSTHASLDFIRHSCCHPALPRAQFFFLYAAPMDLMAGQVEIGAIAAQAAFGETADVSPPSPAMLPISTVSAMTMAGPRVSRSSARIILQSEY